MAPPSRHIVLVTIDTFRADRLGRGVSPELDALAVSSVQFTMARTAVPLTLPAHTTLLTGQLPPAHGVRLNGETLDADVPTLATALKGAGYRTAAFVGAYVLDRRFGLARGFDTYDDRIPRDAAATDALEASRPGAAVVDAALAWLEQATPDPFLLWVHLYDPHAPYAAPEPWRSRFAAQPYDGEVAYAGAQVGRLLARLEARGLTDSTIVVVAGDHGEGLGDHGESTHGMLAYDSTLRVPLLVRAPGLTPAVAAVPVSLADVARSVLQLSGARAELPDASRRTLRDPDPRGEVYAETTYPAVAGWHPLHVLASATHKLIRSATLEYYDVAADAAESTNLADRDTAAARAAVGRLSPLMTTARQAAGPDAAALAQLRALGYASGPSAQTTRANAPNPSTTTADWTRFERAAETPATEVTTLAALAAAHPDGYVFVTSHARALAARGAHREAMRALADAVTRFPTEAALFHDLAVAARAAGDAAEAVRAEDAALALDPRLAAAHNGRGLLHADAGNDAAAAAAFTRAVDIDASNATYWSNLGNARRATGDDTGAADAFDRALALDPGHADAANGRGVMLVQAGRAAEAVDLFTRALGAAPDFHEARLNLGIAYQQAGRPAEAAAAWRDVLRRAPKNATRERQAAQELLGSLR
jgi:arylsulfatase A-like enzyme